MGVPSKNLKVFFEMERTDAKARFPGPVKETKFEGVEVYA
jgi:hypothetical protein